MSEVKVPEVYIDIAKILRKQKVLVFLPSEHEYELSVATANLLYRFTRPDCVAQPETVGEVEAVVRIAREYKKLITVKGGGHSYAGFSTTDSGILLDLKRMNEVELQLVDGKPTTVTIQPGARWGDVYRTLVNGRHNGYVINGGRCPSVGVGGFALGGGLGPFTRSIGMGSDCLREATVVTVKGDAGEVHENKGDEVKRVRVKRGDDAKTDNGKLFWALQGGGCGNFGVVTEMKMDVKKLKNDKVIAGRYTWYPLIISESDNAKKKELLEQRRGEVLKTMNNFYQAKWSSEMTIDSNWIRDINESKGLGIRFTIYYDGPEDKFAAEIDNNLKDTDLGKQLAAELKRRALPEESTRFFYESLVLLWEEEAKNFIPRIADNSYQLYNSFVFDSNTKFADITKIVQDAQDKFTNDFQSDRCILSATFIHTGGVANTIPTADTAYPWRSASFHLYLTFQWWDKWVERKARDCLTELTAKLRPLSLDKCAAFINFADDTLPPTSYEAAYYGSNVNKLRDVKKIWDKDNFFRNKQGITLPPTDPPKTAPQLAQRPVADQGGLTDVRARTDWRSFYVPRESHVSEFNRWIRHLDSAQL